LYSGHDLALKTILKVLEVWKKETHFGGDTPPDSALDPICRAANFRPFGHDTTPLVR
jgi:hypothetical protein